MASVADERAPDRDDGGREKRARSKRFARARQYPVTRFNSVVFDVDSTLSGIEGIDWLAMQRGSQVAAWSAALTERAMRGEIPIEAVYGERMRAVKPTFGEIQRLGQEYVDRIAPQARETLKALHTANVTIAMVSGGLREAILPLAAVLGV